MSMIRDRLQKNLKRLAPWAERNRFEAYRIYDWDIPEYPFFVDRYKDALVVSDRGNESFERDQQHLDELMAALTELNLVNPERIHLKRRRAQTRFDKYQRHEEKNEFFWVQEGPAKLLVNLTDYLDTGLFLDHRPLRERVRKEAKDKKVLNLFCYTGAISVAAALGGGKVTSVDLSNTYLEWAEKNFKLNDLDTNQHAFLREDVLQWLRLQPKAALINQQPKASLETGYDIIILDPPIFSNSKKMTDLLDTERDHPTLVRDCMRLLNPGGVLYFSTNKNGFRLNPELTEEFRVQDLTEATIPQDFHRKKVHVCYRITVKPA